MASTNYGDWNTGDTVTAARLNAPWTTDWTVGVDHIIEKTAAHGVNIDGVLCKDSVVTANVTGNVTGNTSGSSGSCTGLAATATALATARTIGGTSFDGTANIDPATSVNHSGTYAHDQAVAKASTPEFAGVTLTAGVLKFPNSSAMSSNMSVAGINYLYADTTGGSLTIQGLQDGATGQVILVSNVGTNNNIVLAHNGTGTQKFQNFNTQNVFIKNRTFSFIFFNGSNWQVLDGATNS